MQRLVNASNPNNVQVQGQSHDFTFNITRQGNISRQAKSKTKIQSIVDCFNYQQSPNWTKCKI